MKKLTVTRTSYDKLKTIKKEMVIIILFQKKYTNCKIRLVKSDLGWRPMFVRFPTVGPRLLSTMNRVLRSSAIFVL